MTGPRWSASSRARRVIWSKPESRIPPFLIPTLSRAKLSPELSYPTGAEDLSQGLRSAPQLREIALHFYTEHLSRCPANWEVIRIEFLNGDPATHRDFDLRRRPERSRWELIVHPVPRKERHLTGGQIREFALPRIARWLEERAKLDAKGERHPRIFLRGKSGRAQVVEPASGADRVHEAVNVRKGSARFQTADQAPGRRRWSYRNGFGAPNRICWKSGCSGFSTRHHSSGTTMLGTLSTATSFNSFAARA